MWQESERRAYICNMPNRLDTHVTLTYYQYYIFLWLLDSVQLSSHHRLGTLDSYYRDLSC